MPRRRRTPFHEPPDWVADAVFYQIFPDRFASSARVPKPGNLEPWGAPPTLHGFKGGDLLGVVEKLDYLEELGVNALYLNPIFSSASNHRYHTFDYYQVDPLLGGNEGLRELLDEAHARGMRVVLDGVFNHASRGFWAFHHILETGARSPYIDWFTVKGWPLHAYSPRKKPNYEAWWGLPALPQLNVANPDTREYLLGVAEHWIRFGADGWRLDVPHEIDDPEFWREFRRRIRAANPEAYSVGEIWREAPEWLGGDRFDALMNYPFHRTALGLCCPELRTSYRPNGFTLRCITPEEALEELTHQDTCYRAAVVRAQLNLLGSHDTPRFLTLAGGDHSALHLATLLQMTLPGAPCVYYGDEVGMEGGGDPDCRRSFPWRRSEWHRPTWSWFRKAIALRRSEPALRRGIFRPIPTGGDALAFLRAMGRHRLLVAFNFGAEPTEVSLDPGEKARGRRAPEELWSSRLGAPRWEGKASLHLRLPGRSARVVRL